MTKARILDAVREVKGDARAEAIRHLKKGEMASQAEQLLIGSGWLPVPLRTAGVETMAPPVGDSTLEAGDDQSLSGLGEETEGERVQDLEAGTGDRNELIDSSLSNSHAQDIAAE